MEYKANPKTSKTKRGRIFSYKTQLLEKFQRIFEANNFFDAAAPVFVFALSFGAMPMYGICSGDPYKLEFRWKSFRFFYSLTLIMSQIMFLITIINSSIQNGFTISKMSKFWFRCS